MCRQIDYTKMVCRAKFLPAIAKIKQNMVIFNLNTGVDYRKYGDKGDRPFYWLAQNVDKSELKNYFWHTQLQAKLRQDL